MTDIKQIIKDLKIDDDVFQDRAESHQRKIKALILEMMQDAVDDHDKRAILGAFCAAYVSSMLLFKPANMTAEDCVNGAATSVYITGMQMIDFTVEELTMLKSK